MSLVSFLCFSLFAHVNKAGAVGTTVPGSIGSTYTLNSRSSSSLRALEGFTGIPPERSLDDATSAPSFVPIGPSATVPIDLSEATVFLGDGLDNSTFPSSVVDGDTTFIDGVTPVGFQDSCAEDPELSVTVDLGAVYRVSGVRVWHDWQSGPRMHCSQKIELSMDNDAFTSVYSTGTNGFGPVEVAEGNLFSFKPLYARFVRHLCGRSNASSEVPFVEMKVYSQPNDFDWGLGAASRFVNITRNEATNDATIGFLFSVGDSRPVYKQFKTTLFNIDCSTPATVPHALTATLDDSDADYLYVSVDIDQSLVGSSSYWLSSSVTSGEITFCLLVQYLLVNPADPSDFIVMNFLNTAVSMNVDLSVSFSITNVSTQVVGGEVWAQVEYEYEVMAEFCDEVDPSTEFQQGSSVSICISTAADVPTYVAVDRIEELTIRQEGPGAISMNLISDSEDGILTQTICTVVECRVRIQLPSVFFTAKPMKDLELEGVAILTLDANNATRRVLRRRLDDEDRLPETSTGFNARVHITDNDETHSDTSSAKRSIVVLPLKLLSGVVCFLLV